MTIHGRVAIGAALLLSSACGGGASGPAVPYGVSISVDGGFGHVSSADHAFDCTTGCVQTFTTGATVTLLATPAPGYRFTGWRGSCTGSAECTLFMDSSKSVRAVFGFAGPPNAPGGGGGIASNGPGDMHQYVSPIMVEKCDDGAGDGDGTLAFLRHAGDPDVHVDWIEFVTEQGQLLGHQVVDMGAVVFQQPWGISVLAGAPYDGPFANRVVQLTNFGSGANLLGTTYLGVGVGGSKPFAAADPSGQLVLAGDFALANSWGPTVLGGTSHGMAKFKPAATPDWAPQSRVDSPGAVFGVGVDLFSRTLVVTDGTAHFGPGAISAQWFDLDGRALTSEFALLTGFTPGPATWFEVTPLVHSGLLVQRIDADGTALHAHALVTVPSGMPTPEPAPAWMVARPDSRFQRTPASNAYAVLPLRANGVPCTQRLEIVSPDGVPGGAQEYKIADGLCDTHDLTLGLDGTVMQRLPDAMEQTSTSVPGTTCTWRWWTRAVR